MLPRRGRRLSPFVAAGVLAPLLWSSGIVVAPVSDARAVSSEGPGPALLTSRSARLAALTCSGDLEASQRPPILLIPGTALTAEENWGPSYRPVLVGRGHAVCLLDLPVFGTRDAQANVEYVATAIRTMGRVAARRISVIGQSQGALLSQVALRTWPDLRAEVDDVVGLAGVYDHGSAALAAQCTAQCTPVLHQLAAGSAFLNSIGPRPLPTGPSYTNIGTLGDQTVTPQRRANEQPGARSILVQDVCPGRQVQEPEHAMLVGDAVALELTLDALDNPGASVVDRIDPSICETQYYAEFDDERFLAAAPSVAARTKYVTRAEPPLTCRMIPTCRSVRLRGRMISPPKVSVKTSAVVARFRAITSGKIKIRLAGQVVRRQVAPGPFRLRVKRPDKGARLVVSTRPSYYVAWATEGTKWVKPRKG